MEDDLEKMKAEEPEKKESDTEKTDTEETDVEASEVKKRMPKKTGFSHERFVNVPTMKSLGLGKVEEISRSMERMDRLRNMPNIDRDIGLNRLTDVVRKANQFATMTSVPKTMGLGNMYRQLEPSVVSELSKFYLENGFVKNANAIQATLIPSFHGSGKSFNFTKHIQAMDAAISFREMATTINALQNSTIPHMSLYRGIFDSIDEDTYNLITEEIVEEEIIEEIEVEEKDSTVEDVVVARPECLHIALTINTYVTVTENHVHSSPGVTDEEKKAWMKVVKPILIQIIGMFLSWAFGYSMDGIMDYFEPFEKIAEISEEYHYPIETTEVEDVDVNNEP